LDSSLVNTLFEWIAAHPHAAGAAVFAIAFSESLALVGLFMPGAVLMFAIGALIGGGGLAFWPTASWAAAGAIAGDGVSFWLGRKYHQQLKVMWPLRTHPNLVLRASDFFYRHGGKSILLGRFIGPIRPVIPAVAGMLDMSFWRFLITNVVSALLWAPAYLLPGMVFGASLGLAAEVATRLVIILLILLGLTVAIIWLIRTLFALLHPRAHTIIARVLEWTRLHPVAGDLPAALLDPEHREAKGLTILALLLLLAGACFFFLLEAVEARGAVAGLDRGLYEGLQALRTPVMDRLMVAVTELGDWQVLVSVFCVLLGWLLWQRRWQAAAHWTAAGGFSLILSQGLKSVTRVVRPTELYEGISAYSFPSGHATHATVVYGFLAVLLARELPERWRWLAYVAVTPLIAAIAFSRVYLGAHWLSDVLGGLALGLAWVALLGIAYRRHPAATLSLKGLLGSAFMTVVVAGGWHVANQFGHDLERYAISTPGRTLDESQWWATGWRTVPAYRSDLRHTREYPLNIQYGGNLTRLKSELLANGWRTPMKLTGSSWLRWLAGSPDLRRLPVLPQVHNGRHESLLLILPEPKPDEALALRLWRSDTSLGPKRVPLWVGTINRLALTNSPFGITVPRTAPVFRKPLSRLTNDLGQLEHKLETRSMEIRRERSVVLVRAND